MILVHLKELGPCMHLCINFHFIVVTSTTTKTNSKIIDVAQQLNFWKHNNCTIPTWAFFAYINTTFF